MNASDDRSVGAFRTALEAATQMRPMLGSDPRPNCLVIDEIDGAPAVSTARRLRAERLRWEGRCQTGMGIAAQLLISSVS